MSETIFYANKGMLVLDFIKHIEIIRKKFPKSITIEKTECNSLLNGNTDRLLLKKEHYNEYCLAEIPKGTGDFSFTIFKSDWKNFERIESDFMDGFSFAPKNVF